MVKSTVTSITPAQHANNHRHGGTDPLTGDVRVDDLSVNDGAEAVVHTGNAPVAWTDLDLSAVVGAQTRIVGLKMKMNIAAATTVVIRKKGDTRDYTSTGTRVGVQMVNLPANGTLNSMLVVATDASGVIQWKASGANSIEVSISWYK